MRNYVRDHIDIEEDDLPSSVLDLFIREGSKRIERAEVRWPFFESTFTLLLLPGQFEVTKASINPNLDQITTITHGDNHPALSWIGFDTLQDLLSRSDTTGRTRFFSEWANNVSFFPAADIQYTLTVHGYRTADDWVVGGAGAVPDLPDELHNTIVVWALSKAYAQQEDPELASLYERQFSDELNEFRRRLAITPHNQPLVMNGGSVPERATLLARPRFDWEAD